MPASANDQHNDVTETATPAENGHADVLDACALAAAPPSGAPSIPGYRITRMLGGGGQGEVWQAIDQSNNTKVAVKVIRADRMTDPESKARFEQERRMLMLLEHPHIVRTLGFGELSTGELWHAMHYVVGQPLDRYIAALDQQVATNSPAGPRGRFPLRRVLELFVQICDALQSAHQLGIVHRDLKPANILVDENGKPHLLDFGLARAPVATSPDAVTLTGIFMGSPAWASPEQVDAQPARIDARSDVYSLGVILYHAVTGTFPYDVTPPLAKVFDQIRYVDPVPPSQLATCVDDELEAVILTTLAKDRQKRYPSVRALAEDLERYLRNEPVSVKGDSRWYRFRKLVSRHRAMAASIAVAFVLTLGFGAGMTGLYLKQIGLTARAAKAEHETSRQNLKREQFQRLFGSILTDRRGRDVTVAQAVDWGVFKLNQAPLPDREIEAAVRSMFGDVYLGLGDYGAARRELETAIAIQRATPDTPPRDLVDSLMRLAKVGFDASELAAAEALLLEADAVGANPPGASLHALGEIYFEGGQIELASRMFMRSYELASAADRESPLLADSLNNQAYVLVAMGENETGEALYRLALAAQREKSRGDDPALATTLNNLGLALLYQGYGAQGEPFVNEALAMRRRLFHDEDKAIANSYVALGFLELVRGNLELSESHYRDALAMQGRIFGMGDHLATAFTRASLAAVLHESGRHEEGEQLYAEATEAYQRLAGQVPRFVPMFYIYNRAVLHERRGDDAGAHELFSAALETFKEDDPRNAYVALALSGMGRALHRMNDDMQADALLRESLAMRRELLGDRHGSVVTGLVELAAFLCARQQAEEPGRLLDEARGIRAAALPRSDWLVALIDVRLGEHLASALRLDEASTLLISALKTMSEELGEADPRVIRAREAHAGTLEPEEAAGVHRNEEAKR